MALTPTDTVNGMTGRMNTWFTALPLSICVITNTLANETKINEHKNNRTSDAISNADYVRHADRHSTVDVDTVTDINRRQTDRAFAAPDFYLQMEQRRERFLKQVEERKHMMDMIRDEHRKAAEKRRNARLQQMNQTRTKTASADNA